MSKELIERLRALAPYANPHTAGLMHEAADALEAKAAPVGEREACIEWFREAEQAELRKSCAMGWAVYCFQAGAAYQRAQQPQSAEPAGYFCAPFMRGRFEQVDSSCAGDEDVFPLYTTPQPSAGVVMPEIPWQWSQSLTHCWPDDKDDRDGDWCVGCIDEEGNFYEVVKVEASQYDAAGESQKIAEAIVALWEFARLNGKEVGRG